MLIACESGTRRIFPVSQHAVLPCLHSLSVLPPFPLLNSDKILLEHAACAQRKKQPLVRGDESLLLTTAADRAVQSRVAGRSADGTDTRREKRAVKHAAGPLRAVLSL